MNKYLFIAVWAAVCLSACSEDQKPTLSSNGDYFPVSQLDRTYLREQFSDPETRDRFFYDTVRIAYAADTLINNRTYHILHYYSRLDVGSPVVYSDVYKMFRKEGNQYKYLFDQETKSEHIFLDPDKPVGYSWMYDYGFENSFRMIYTVKGKEQTKVVNGRIFQDVIQMDVEGQYLDVDGQYKRVTLAHNFYANGVGEIDLFGGWYLYRGALRLSTLE